MDREIAGGISYFVGCGVLSANSLPANKGDAEDLIGGRKVAGFNDTIATIKSTNKCKLSDSVAGYGDYTGSGAHVVYIKFDTSGNTLWLALVTFTNGSGTVAWSSFKNANDVGSSGGPSGGGDLPANSVTGLTVPSALQGTWVGDETNGTLVFTATGVGSLPAGNTTCKAYSSVVAGMRSSYSPFTITDDKIKGTSYSYPFDLYSYTISGNTLTILDANDDTRILFTGTKQ